MWVLLGRNEEMAPFSQVGDQSVKPVSGGVHHLTSGLALRRQTDTEVESLKQQSAIDQMESVFYLCIPSFYERCECGSVESISKHHFQYRTPPLLAH